jgi:NADPH2:quinone reductase
MTDDKDLHWVATDFGGLDIFRLAEFEVPAPGADQVTIDVRAAGMNPADYKHVARGTDRSILPVAIGYEVSGVVSAVGSGASFAVGDEVLAFRIKGGYATRVTVPAKDVFLKPHDLGFPDAANLLLAGSTAAEALHVTKVTGADTVLVHGASGAVGVSLMQQATLVGARIIGTASESSFATIERFGGEPVAYGDGLEQRVRELAPDGVDVAVDTVGTDEAIDVSLALVADRDRIVTIAAAPRAQKEGFHAIGGTMPASARYRDEVRAHLLELAGSGELVVPIARTFPLKDGVEALELLKGGHPGGKLALIP